MLAPKYVKPESEKDEKILAWIGQISIAVPKKLKKNNKIMEAIGYYWIRFVD